jgi:hypothetical protein
MNPPPAFAAHGERTELVKALPRQEAAVPQNRRSQHDGSIEARNLRTALGLR